MTASDQGRPDGGPFHQGRPEGRPFAPDEGRPFVRLARAARSLPPSLMAVALMAPLSLVVLYLWTTTPSAASPHAMHGGGAAALTRPVVFLTAWMLMTAAMMLPSAMPLLVSLDRIAKGQSSRHAIPVVAALAYLGVWGLVGLAAWITSAVAEVYLLPRASTQVVSGLAGAGLVLAGVYGLSPLASACLRACRRPFGFLARYWRGGASARLQAARIGAAYGVSCVGCCVPMLGIMFVVGMANMAIVIAMGVLMVIMKASVVGTQVARLLSIALIVVGLAIGLAPAAGAQAQGAPDRPRFNMEIVVTPERSETPRASVPVATSVLTDASIPTLPAAHVSELLPFITGFVTARPEFHAGRPVVSARGFFGGGEAEYMLLLVDGVPIADVESGLIDWAVAPASSLTRLEASRGPGSSLYGDSAVGGVVQLLTNRDATGGRLSLAGGSFATFVGDGSYGRRRPGLSFDVSGAARSTNGAYEHAAAEQFGGTGGVDGRVGGFAWRWNATANLHEREDPGALTRDQWRADPTSSAPAYRFDMADRRMRSTAFTLRPDSPGWRPQARVYASGRDEDSIRTILLAPNFGERYARDLATTAIGGSVESEQRLFASRPLRVRFGLDLSHESLDSTYRSVGQTGAIGEVVDGANGDRLRSGVFASAAWETAPRVRLSAALRWDQVDDDGFGNAGSDLPSAEAWSPRAGIVVRANDAGTISVFGQISRAFKMPTLDQLFDVRPFPDFRGGTLTLSNPNLQPQRATNVEGGVSGSSARVSWSAVAYRMTVTNEIDFDVRTFSYANIGRSEHTGFELETEGRWWSRVRPSVSYALSRAVDADTDLQLKNVARHVFAAGASADLWWSIGVFARYLHTAGAFLDDDNALPLDGPSRLDVRVRRPVGRHLAFLDVYNAANHRYEEYGFTLSDFAGRVVPYVYPGAGAAVRAGVTLSY